MGRIRVAAAALIVVAGLAACGSTVPPAARTSSGLPESGIARQQSGLDSDTAGTVSAPGAATNANRSAAAGSAGHRAVSGASTAPIDANGPGVTDTTITIGVSYYQNAAAANAAIGARNVNTGDPVASTRTVIDDINAHGGMAGRKIELLLFAVDPQSSTPYAAEAQAMCTYFTQDHKVFAVIDGAPAADARACLDQHGVSILGSSLVKNFQYPHEFDPYTGGTARAFAALVPSLASQGWFGPWDRLRGTTGTTKAKVGIVTADDPRENAIIDGVLVKGLRDAGYAPAAADIIRITEPGGFTDDGAAVAQIDNAALKLNADGVDHVILDDSNSSLALLFNNYAYSQRYFPRYGGTTGNGWQVLLSSHNIQPDTLRGALGIGWQPLFDVPYQSGDGPNSNPARHACLALFAAHGMAASDAASAGGQAEVCDIGYLLQFPLRGYRGPLNAAVFKQRVEALGTSYELASGLGSRFGPDKRDGAGGYAFMQFDGGCGCMKYVSGVRPF